MKAYLIIFICMSGPSCPDVPINGKEIYYNLLDCEKDAKLVAQGMYVMSKNKYGFKCVNVDYEPPNLGEK